MPIPGTQGGTVSRSPFTGDSIWDGWTLTQGLLDHPVLELGQVHVTTSGYGELYTALG